MAVSARRRTVGGVRILLAGAVVAGLIAVGPAAQSAGGPTEAHPASVTLTAREAHQAATFLLSGYYLPALPKPHYGHAGACEGGMYVWRCPARFGGADSVCRATEVVWADDLSYYVELHHLRCDARS